LSLQLAIQLFIIAFYHLILHPVGLLWFLTTIEQPFIARSTTKMLANISNSTALDKACTFEMDTDIVKELRSFFLSGVVVACVIIPPTIALNALVLIGIYKTPILHIPSNVLLFGLALTDLAAGLIALPIFLVVGWSYYSNQPELWCRIRVISIIIVPPLSGISFATLSLISFDRMLALKYHMRYASIVTNRRVICALCFVWITCFLFSISQIWNKHVLNWSSVIVFALCFTICTVNNGIIFRILHRHRVAIAQVHKQLEANAEVKQNDKSETQTNMSQSRRSSKNMLWVYLIFIACLVPFLIVKTVRNIGRASAKTKTMNMLFNLSYSILYLNSLFNPIFYCIKMKPIRRAVLKLIPERCRRLLMGATQRDVSSYI